jgi:hypothetical protein
LLGYALGTLSRRQSPHHLALRNSPIDRRVLEVSLQGWRGRRALKRSVESCEGTLALVMSRRDDRSPQCGKPQRRPRAGACRSRLPRSRSADDLPDVLTRLGDCDHIVWFHATVVCRWGPYAEPRTYQRMAPSPAGHARGWASPRGRSEGPRSAGGRHSGGSRASWARERNGRPICPNRRPEIRSRSSQSLPQGIPTDRDSMGQRPPAARRHSEALPIAELVSNGSSADFSNKSRVDYS